MYFLAASHQDHDFTSFVVRVVVTKLEPEWLDLEVLSNKICDANSEFAKNVAQLTVSPLAANTTKKVVSQDQWR